MGMPFEVGNAAICNVNANKCDARRYSEIAIGFVCCLQINEGINFYFLS